MFDNSDDYDFTPTSSSNLASLFDVSMTKLSNVDEQLIYKAPKQPKPSKTEPKTNIETTQKRPESSVICAKAVNVWKLENENYADLGKYGIAIIGNSVLNIYELILYKEKNNITLKVSLNESFTFLNQDDCFSTFYDNFKKNWLVKFDSMENQTLLSDTLMKYKVNVVKGVPKSVEKTPESQSESIPDPSGSDSSQIKADILSRITRMGQQILPNSVKTTSTDQSDSELEENRLRSKPYLRKHSKKAVIEEKPIRSESKSVVEQRLGAVYQQDKNMLPYTNPSLPNSNMIVNYDPISFLAMQNTDVKSNLNEISSKIDILLKQMNFSTGPKDDVGKPSNSKIKTLELRCENLQFELEKSNKKFEQLKREFEESIAKHSNVNESVMKSNEETINNLKSEISILKNDKQNLEETNALKIKNQKELIEELEKTVLNQKQEMIELKKTASQDYDYLKLQNEELLKLNKTLEEQLENIKGSDIKVTDPNENVKVISDLIKNEMNDMYQVIRGKIENTDSNIEQAIAVAIKNCSYRLISKVKDHFKI